MLTDKKILNLFNILNSKLESAGQVGEIGIVGGAAMCLAFQARNATQDIDGIFEPSTIIRKFVKEMAESESLNEDWLKDAAKGFIQGNFKKINVAQFSHLRIWAPEPKYMLAMKSISARWDSLDKSDVEFLIKLLKLNSAKSVFEIIETYYPKQKIPPKTQFLIEELFEEKKKS